MPNLRKPHWIFLVNTAPVLLLLALCWGEFSIVRTLLPPASVAQWQRFGLALGGLGLVGAAYAAAGTLRRQPLGVAYSVAALLAYSLLLCLFTSQADEVLPRNVPRWMVPTDLVVIAWTFLMPTLAHAMLALVARLTPDEARHSAGFNIGMAVLVPLVWAVVGGVLSGVTSLFGSGNVYATVVLVASAVLSTLAFFFFLVRAVYVVGMRRTGFWAESRPVWKGVVTVALPVLGLAVNSGLFMGGLGRDTGIFGNFSSPWFYVLAVLNGALLCLPDPARPAFRLLLLGARGALFGYTFYFFLVFLPFLPLSLPAIILIGMGFLMLTPTLLFVVHVRQLGDDLVAVRAHYPRAVGLAVLGAGLAVLPLFITGSYWHSRQVLHEALAQVYTPNYARQPRLDGPALTRTLAVVRQQKDQGRDLLSGSQLPYLSAYFNWLVLDNLMLSDHKIAELEAIFTGAPAYQISEVGFRPTPAGPAAPELRALTATSTYDAGQQAWVSWVSLEIANTDSAVQSGEYRTAIALPPGCWVSDYYLTIGNRQERGLLAEKKAAAWVFAQIVNENSNRDPGLLAYRGPNEVSLRVYPVVGSAPRRTRFQLLHKEPCTLRVDGRLVALGDSRTVPPVDAPVATADGSTVYLSGRAKLRLPRVRRRPYYHFLVDAAVRPGLFPPLYQGRVAQLLARPLPQGGPPRFSLVDAYSTPVAAGADWQQALGRTLPTGSCNLTGAIRRVLFAAHQRPAATYPILVVVTDQLEKAVMDEGFEDFSSAYPESDVFYVLGADGRPVPHSLRRRSRQPLNLGAVHPADASPAVRAWPTAAHPRAYLPDNDVADVVVLSRPPAVPVAGAPAAPGAAPGGVPVTNRWLTGLLLHGYGQWQSFHPETTDRERVPFVEASFRTGIMTPFTSYLALENEAQKAALRRKQAQVLAANASLDIGEDVPDQPIETPLDGGVGLLAVLGALLAGWYLRRGVQPA